MRTAEFAIAIGERRGQGLGTEATRLVLDFAFHVLQLRNVLLETLEWNVAGLTAYERAGFRRVGVRRGAVMSRGEPTDIVIVPPSDSASCDRAAAVPGGHLAVDQGYVGSVDGGCDPRDVGFSKVVWLAAQRDAVDLAGERLEVTGRPSVNSMVGNDWVLISVAGLGTVTLVGAARGTSRVRARRSAIASATHRASGS